MKKLFSIAIIFCLVLLVGCSSKIQPKSYFQLPPSIKLQSHQSAVMSHQLWIESVSLNAALDGPGIVYQTNDLEYVVANKHLWLTPLSAQLTQSLQDNLSYDLPNWLVTTQPIDTMMPKVILRINVTGFHGRYDGHAVVSGDWILIDKSSTIKQPFFIITPLQADGYHALVNALTKAWQEQSHIIASKIIKID